ncbi:MAG: UvrD-helicase domain-containing protein [Synechococcus sp. ELA057]
MSATDRTDPSAAPISGGLDPERDRFDANGLSLDPGLRLLEASAGTGKTFALAHLVLRLVSERGLPLRQILVVTFTDAAAAELRDRIGRRLQAGLDALETPDRKADDAVLEIWREGCRGLPAAQQERMRLLLLLALEELDGADITTIHGFCRRSLQREALSAGLSPQLRLQDPDDPVIAEVVHAYWMQQVLPLPPHLLSGLRRCGIGPRALEDLLRQLESDPALTLEPLPEGLEPEQRLEHFLPQLWQSLWEDFVLRWRADGRALQAALQEEARRWKQQQLGDSKPYAANPRKDRCAEIDGWLNAQPPDGDYAAVLGQGLLSNEYHPGTFSKVARRLDGRPGESVRLPHPALMTAVAAVVDAPAEAALLHALSWCRRELERRRRRLGVCSFGQLLRELDPGPGAQAPTPLLASLAGRYRAALIDEFQDTDPVQWRILRMAFGLGDHLLVMVGDPKQAIYRFRGGDLGTYLEAAASVDTRLQLRENRRSSKPLIEGLNRLMRLGLPRSGLEAPALEACSGRQGPSGAPMALLWLGERAGSSGSHPSRADLERSLVPLVARYVRQLIQGDLQLVDAEASRALALGDVCLLVHNHRQSELLRSALEREGIASRLVNKADVYTTRASTALQRLLDALADPADANRLRLLAASPLLGWSPARITAASELDWGALADRLERMAALLPRRGLLGILVDLLGADGLARLARLGRFSADLQQVAEGMQQRIHSEQLAPAGAADWLRRRRLDPPRQVAEQDQSQSDRADGAVSVLTIHRSKGLEFPVVICPFLWQSAATQARSGMGRRYQPPGAAAPLLDLHRNLDWGQGFAAERQRLLAEEEERERLAYVAMTRAQHLLVLAWGPARDQQCAPLLPWLFASEPLPTPEEDAIAPLAAAAWRERLEREITGRDLPIRLLDRDDLLLEAQAQPGEPDSLPPLLPGAVPTRAFDRRWGRSSYSSWVKGASHAPEAAGDREEGRDTADLSSLPEPGDGVPEAGSAPDPDGSGWEAQGPLSVFPRGAAAGDCLHRILEGLDYSQPAAADPHRRLAERELQRSGLAADLLEPVFAGLELVRTTPLGGDLGALRLADLTPQRWLPEMRFDLVLDLAQAPQLAAAFSAWPGGWFGDAYGEQLARLPIDSRGFLTGAIDLVFPATGVDGQERWWVLDWKSNWLGPPAAAGSPGLCGPRHYGPEAMAGLMAASHYPLQAHLYLVALHRYLGWRLVDYDPERHLGGYAYVFLRGVPGSSGAAALPGTVPGMLVERPPLGRILALDQALGLRSADGWPGGEEGG